MKNAIISSFLLLSGTLLFLTAYTINTKTVKIEEVYLLSDRIMINTVTHDNFLDWTEDEVLAQIKKQAQEEFKSKGKVEVELIDFKTDDNLHKKQEKDDDIYQEAGIITVNFRLTWTTLKGTPDSFEVERTMLIGEPDHDEL